MPRKGQFVSRDKLAAMFALYMRVVWENVCNPSPALARTVAKWEALLISVKPAN
jgi:hypothetical protein